MCRWASTWWPRPRQYIDPKTQKEKRRSPVSKNDVGVEELLKQAVRNRIPFSLCALRCVGRLGGNMVFIKQQLHRDFICPLKTTRKVALSKADKQQGRYVRVDTLELEAQATREIYLEGVDFPLVLVKQVFTNEDGSVGLRSLVSSDTPLSFDDAHHDLSHTVGSGMLSQVAQTECLVSQVPHPNRDDPNQSFLCRAVRLYQIGAVAKEDQAESFCS